MSPAATMTSNRTMGRLMVVLVLLLAAGCGAKPPRPTVADVDLAASGKINPDDTGNAKPLSLRLYQLKAVSAFDRADYHSLYKSDKEVLAADLLVREDIQVEPGMHTSFSRKLDPDAKYVAVFAPFRYWERAKWKAALEIPPNKTTLLALDLDALQVALTIKPEPKDKKK